MIREMHETSEPIDLGAIRDLEKHIGFPLPDPYVRFLLKHNGGRPVPAVFPIHGMENNPEGEIQVFFGIGRIPKSSDLRWNFDVMRGRIPDHMFPVACNDSGSLICLSVGGPVPGEVVLWNFYEETPGAPQKGIYHVAVSFQEFLESLQDDSEMGLGGIG